MGLAIAGLAVAAGSAIAGGVMSAGSKPKVPDFKPLDIGAAQTQSLDTNLQNFSKASQLTSKTNAFNTDQIKQMLEQANPGSAGIIAQQRGVIQSELQGQIPQGAVDFLSRQAASRAVGAGVGGSGAGANFTLESLGLNSLGQIQQGFNHAQQWLAAGQQRIGSPMDVQSMFISPNTALQAQAQNNAGQFQQQWMANQIAAAPDPTMAAIGRGLSSFGSSAGGMLAGGAFGGDAAAGAGGFSNQLQAGMNNGTIGTSWNGGQLSLGQVNSAYGNIFASPQSMYQSGATDLVPSFSSGFA